jgi:hypothetical protein
LITLGINFSVPLFLLQPISCYALIGFFFFLIIIPFDYCWCSSSFEGNHIVCREIFSKRLDRGDFQSILGKNRSIPPQVSIYVEAYHYHTWTERTTTTDSEGRTHTHTTTHTEKIITYRNTQTFQYSFWEEKGDSIRMKETSILHCICTYKIDLDRSAQAALNYQQQQMLNVARMRDVCTDSAIKYYVSDFKESVAGCISESPPAIYEFYTSCFGKFLWIFFTLIGFQSTYECIWCSQGLRMKLRLKKTISMEPKYRCHFNEEDYVAAETTFRIDSLPASRIIFFIKN